MSERRSFAAIVLAGSRADGDPVAEQFGVASKAQVPVGGQPMLLRVLNALADCALVDEVTVVGLPDAALEDPSFAAAFRASAARRIPGAATPSASAAVALDQISDGRPVLVTTADHALLSAEIVETFLAGTDAVRADLVVGLARHETVDALLPGMRRTVTRFEDGGFCGCNLFAFMTPAGRGATGFWQQVEAHRKRPARIARILGPWTLLRYLLGRLSLEAALRRLSTLCGARVKATILPYGEAAIDVDKPEDLAVAESLVRGRPS